jgi:hypothetical protein
MVKKLRLQLDDLAVASFDTACEVEERRGTVEAQALDPTRRTACPTCDTLCPTCVTLCLPYC